MSAAGRAHALREYNVASLTSLSRRCERLSLLHNIGDQNSGSDFWRFATRVGRFGRYLEAIAGLDCAGWLTFYGQLEAALHDIGGFDSRMGVPGDFGSGLDCCFHKQRHITRRRAV